MLVASIMTRDPVVVSPDTSPEEALELMTELDIRHLPVLAGDELVGVVSDRDLLEATGGRPAGERRPETPEEVRDIMACEVARVAPDDTVVSATVDFLVQRIGCLPVVDAGRLVGIVTEMDMLSAFTRMVESGTLPAAAHPEGVVDTLMTRQVRTLAPASTLAQAFELLQRRHVRHLPVLDDGALVGMVSDRDVRRAVGAGRADDVAVREFMSQEPLHVPTGSGLKEAALLMALGKVSALPVLDGDRLAGLLTLSDLLEHCLESLREPETPGQG